MRRIGKQKRERERLSPNTDNDSLGQPRRYTGVGVDLGGGSSAAEALSEETNG